MKGQTITFDGHRLNDLFFTGEVEVGLPDFEVDATGRSGLDGSLVRSVRMGSLEIVVPLVAKFRKGHAARESLATLMQWLDVDEPKALTLSEDGGLVRMVVPTGPPEVTDHYYGDKLTVTLMQPDPWLYGETRTATIPSGSSSYVDINVGGTYPTNPTISATGAKRNGTSYLWGVSLDSAASIEVRLPTSSSTAVMFDCDGRTCTVAGATALPTLSSDWLTLKPGAHRLRNSSGSGAATVTWRERWHR